MDRTICTADLKQVIFKSFVHCKKISLGYCRIDRLPPVSRLVSVSFSNIFCHHELSVSRKACDIWSQVNVRLGKGAEWGNPSRKYKCSVWMLNRDIFFFFGCPNLTTMWGSLLMAVTLGRSMNNTCGLKHILKTCPCPTKKSSNVKAKSFNTSGRTVSVHVFAFLCEHLSRFTSSKWVWTTQ